VTGRQVPSTFKTMIAAGRQEAKSSLDFFSPAYRQGSSPLREKKRKKE